MKTETVRTDSNSFKLTQHYDPKNDELTVQIESKPANKEAIRCYRCIIDKQLIKKINIEMINCQVIKALLDNDKNYTVDLNKQILKIRINYSIGQLVSFSKEINIQLKQLQKSPNNSQIQETLRDQIHILKEKVQQLNQTIVNLMQQKNAILKQFNCQKNKMDEKYQQLQNIQSNFISQVQRKFQKNYKALNLLRSELRYIKQKAGIRISNKKKPQQEEKMEDNQQISQSSFQQVSVKQKPQSLKVANLTNKCKSRRKKKRIRKNPTYQYPIFQSRRNYSKPKNKSTPKKYLGGRKNQKNSGRVDIKRQTKHQKMQNNQQRPIQFAIQNNIMMEQGQSFSDSLKC